MRKKKQNKLEINVFHDVIFDTGLKKLEIHIKKQFFVTLIS